RIHPDAEPHMSGLAVRILTAIDGSTPVDRRRDREHCESWHLPYVTGTERLKYRHDPQLLAKLSAARCARVSFLLHDGSEPTVEKDLALYARLVESRPLHASPCEHQSY